ncbi:hypothetical protein HY480_02690 [Candidatus Uhrbacteria bacterium]|nr:hypothetical protein [Candidatus Uhrbacteria bacterium]
MASRKRANLVSVDMGYGHERAAYALRDLAGGDIITANNYPHIPEDDRALWEQGRTYYETVSRMQPLPVIGKALFQVLVDQFQEIDAFYPRRDLSRLTLQARQVRHAVVTRRQGAHLIESLRPRHRNGKRPLPFISTFFLPAFAAEQYDYPGDIYLVVCDADIARVWAPWNPRKSRIKFFAPNGRVVERLRLYGVRREHIFLTGFPIPKELIGGPRSEIVRHDLGVRLANLDPNGVFRKKYHATLQRTLGVHVHTTPSRPVTITFAVGGAGAQKAIGMTLMQCLRKRIRDGGIRLQLVAGTRAELVAEFTARARELRLHDELGRGIRILHAANRWDYFRCFTEALRKTDILWTKPSELSFYTGVGLPIVMAPPIGSQEDFNREWVRAVGGGTDQLNPEDADEWLTDWIQSGGLARMAWNGYIEAPTHGTYRIESIVTGKPVEVEPLPLIV